MILTQARSCTRTCCADGDDIHTHVSVAHKPDRPCKGEHRNACGNLDDPFPAALLEDRQDRSTLH